MKNIILAFILCFSVVSFASEDCSTVTGEESAEETLEIKTDVPNHLKGATIIVRTADGKETSVPAEKFKVVPRKQQFIVTKTKQTEKTMCSKSKDPNKNRVSLGAGNGRQDGLKTETELNKTAVENKVGAVGSIEYQRLITDTVSVGVQGQTNKTILFKIGLDF